MTKEQKILKAIDSAGFGFSISESVRANVASGGDDLRFSGEVFDNVKGFAFDYYNEQHKQSNVHPELEALIETFGFYCEPINPGECSICEA